MFSLRSSRVNHGIERGCRRTVQQVAARVAIPEIHVSRTTGSTAAISPGAGARQLQRPAGRRIGDGLAGRWRGAARSADRSRRRWVDCRVCASDPKCIAPQRTVAPEPRRSRPAQSRRACERSAEPRRRARIAQAQAGSRRATSPRRPSRRFASSPDRRCGGRAYLSVSRCLSTDISRPIRRRARSFWCSSASRRASSTSSSAVS